jgi:hypothetical protein
MNTTLFRRSRIGQFTPWERFCNMVNRTTLGIRVMHAPNVHHFPLVLAGGDAVPVTTIAPSLSG